MTILPCDHLDMTLTEKTKRNANQPFLSSTELLKT